MLSVYRIRVYTCFYCHTALSTLFNSSASRITNDQHFELFVEKHNSSISRDSRNEKGWNIRCARRKREFLVNFGCLLQIQSIFFLRSKMTKRRKFRLFFSLFMELKVFFCKQKHIDVRIIGKKLTRAKNKK